MKTKREISARLTELRNELTELMQEEPDPNNAWQHKILRIQTSIGVLNWVLREEPDQNMMAPEPLADKTSVRDAGKSQGAKR